MAKKSAIDKNLKRQKKVSSHAARRARLKAIVMDRSLPVEERFEANLKLAKMSRNGAKTRLRNRCQVTGRPRGYYRKLGMSRIALRDLASFGQIPGIVKSSW
jgi:small subunit ribosomal protein S14